MSRILMLTRCQYAEKSIERIIRKLGHELFCTMSILDGIKQGQTPAEFLEQFQIILFSETIANSECQEIIEKLDQEQFMLIQLRGGALSKEEQERKRGEGIHYCLSTSASLETFREVLSKQQTKKAKKIFSMKDNRNYSIEEVQELLNLTKMEKRVFQELRAEEGRIISRDELCRRVWNMESNPSTQSQVSTLIKKIKDKIANLGLNSKCIKTQWGMGYMLDTSILHTPEPSLLYQVQ